MPEKTKTIIAVIILYIISTGVAYATFSFLGSGPGVSNPNIAIDPLTGLPIDPSAPKTEACPLNGQLYTKIEREAWEKRRPLAVMVENSPESRPHSGIIKADIVYEAVAEGGVTRFMPVYYCAAQAKDVTIAPVRSVRTYFIDWASEYGLTPLFGHVGGANCSAEKLPNGNFGPCKTDPRAQAIEQLANYGWRYSNGNDLDQFAVGAPTYIRKPERLGAGKTVATEHSVVASSELLWAEGADRGWTNLDPDGEEWIENFQPWEFKDDAGSTARGQINQISYDFWEGYKLFDARWQYEPAANTYSRFTGGEAHTDLESGDQLFAKNVVVILTKETTSVDELKHNLYKTIGEGEALIFMDGNAIEGFWQKDSRTDRTIFTDKKGEEIKFNRGLIWISVVDTSTKVAH
jgi:hypothetical protein